MRNYYNTLSSGFRSSDEGGRHTPLAARVAILAVLAVAAGCAAGRGAKRCTSAQINAGKCGSAVSAGSAPEPKGRPCEVAGRVDAMFDKGCSFKSFLWQLTGEGKDAQAARDRILSSLPTQYESKKVPVASLTSNSDGINVYEILLTGIYRQILINIVRAAFNDPDATPELFGLPIPPDPQESAIPLYGRTTKPDSELKTTSDGQAFLAVKIDPQFLRWTLKDVLVHIRDNFCKGRVPSSTPPQRSSSDADVLSAAPAPQDKAPDGVRPPAPSPEERRCAAAAKGEKNLAQLTRWMLDDYASESFPPDVDPKILISSVNRSIYWGAYSAIFGNNADDLNDFAALFPSLPDTIIYKPLKGRSPKGEPYGVNPTPYKHKVYFRVGLDRDQKVRVLESVLDAFHRAHCAKARAGDIQ